LLLKYIQYILLFVAQLRIKLRIK
ncbi:hypothetical protein BMETH_24621691268, partial [methanotrophic bacterial endosymbiont of Bathymodiolus sp.]